MKVFKVILGVIMGIGMILIVSSYVASNGRYEFDLISIKDNADLEDFDFDNKVDISKEYIADQLDDLGNGFIHIYEDQTNDITVVKLFYGGISVVDTREYNYFSILNIIDILDVNHYS